MKIAVVANCQVFGFAACLRALLPGAVVSPIPLVGMTPAKRDEFLGGIGQYDLVFVQPANDAAPLAPRSLAKVARRVCLFPAVTFTGFHPDIACVYQPGGSLKSPLGEYHSAIILAAFSLGLPPREARALFNAYIYALAGYPREHALAHAFMKKELEQCQLDATALLDGWCARGCFMYTINHPKLFVLADLAAAAAQKERLIAAAPAAGIFDNLPDTLAPLVQWPVYPEIAQRIGLPGSLSFKRSGAHAAPQTPQWVGLEQLIEESYAIYRRSGAFPMPRAAASIAALLRKELVRA